MILSDAPPPLYGRRYATRSPCLTSQLVEPLILGLEDRVDAQRLVLERGCHRLELLRVRSGRGGWRLRRVAVEEGGG